MYHLPTGHDTIWTCHRLGEPTTADKAASAAAARRTLSHPRGLPGYRRRHPAIFNTRNVTWGPRLRQPGTQTFRRLWSSQTQSLRHSGHKSSQGQTLLTGNFLNHLRGSLQGLTPGSPPLAQPSKGWSFT